MSVKFVGGSSEEESSICNNASSSSPIGGSQGHLSWEKKINCSPKRWILYIDGVYWRSISTSIISRENAFVEIEKKAEGDPAQLCLLFNEIEYKGAYRWAIKQLSMRSIFEKEVRKLLERHCVSENTLFLLLAYLKKRGWINDAQKYESMIEKMKAQGKSSKEIRMKLKGKHSSTNELSREFEDAEEALDDKKNGYGEIGKDHDSEALLKFLTKQMARLKGKSLSYMEKQKLIQKCARRGFSFDLIRSLLERLGFDSQNLEEDVE